MTKTENLNLNQWESTDPIRREDFNADNAAIDAALGELAATMPKIVCGTYTGDGAASRTIELGFTPRMVYVCLRTGSVYQSSSNNRWYYGGLAVSGSPASAENIDFLTIIEGGFQVINNTTYSSVYFLANSNNVVFHYVAIG